MAFSESGTSMARPAGGQAPLLSNTSDCRRFQAHITQTQRKAECAGKAPPRIEQQGQGRLAFVSQLAMPRARAGAGLAAGAPPSCSAKLSESFSIAWCWKGELMLLKAPA